MSRFLLIFCAISILASLQNASALSPLLEHKRVDASALSSVYRFSLEIPDAWEIVWIPAIEAINIYDPAAPGTQLEKSQLFVRYFTADRFLTLSTVTVHSRKPLFVKGHTAMRYEISKKKSVPQFPHQPSWRNARHAVVDIRHSPARRSTFYVFAKNPTLAEDTFQKIMRSLVFYNDSESLKEPLPESANRITKKPFGIFITQQSSPVQPERFHGFHTGSDYEIVPLEEKTPVVVSALCSGPLIEKKHASGYGGVVLQECEQGSQTVTVLYGHMDITQSTYNKGDYLSPGSRIGDLAAANTAASGFERKHLHLGVLKGRSRDLRGYVTSKKELRFWIDPVRFVSSR
ncbi:peptidoglycan DD-metalloendopeptidase family protein [Candidatus Uhrbacteria bacterium]|nr:peptidoglycan DD-metalloendopeptidase family protein [Candidatus Uhrbacteria bacterium]